MMLNYLKLENYRRFSARGIPASGGRHLRLDFPNGGRKIIDHAEKRSKKPVSCPLFPVSCSPR